MNNYCVYKHTSPSGKVYIGLTGQNPEVRFGKDGKGYKLCPYFWRAIRKYGWENIKHEILFSGLTEEEACEKEKELIALYDATNPDKGYNDLIGGTSGKHGRPYTEEQLKKMSEAQKKLWQDKAYREHMSEVHKGKVLPPEQRKKMSEAHKGKPNLHCKGVPLSEETKAKLSFIHKVKNIQPPPARRVPVNQYDLQGKFIQSFPHCRAAGIAMGSKNGGVQIGKVARSGGKAFGYLWKLASEEVTNG